MKITLKEYADFVELAFDHYCKIDCDFYFDFKGEHLDTLYFYDGMDGLIPEADPTMLVDTDDILMTLTDRDGSLNTGTEIEKWRKSKTTRTYIIEFPVEKEKEIDALLPSWVTLVHTS